MAKEDGNPRRKKRTPEFWNGRRIRGYSLWISTPWTEYGPRQYFQINTLSNQLSTWLSFDNGRGRRGGWSDWSVARTYRIMYSRNGRAQLFVVPRAGRAASP